MAQRHNCGGLYKAQHHFNSTRYLTTVKPHPSIDKKCHSKWLLNDGILWEEYPELFVCEPPDQHKNDSTSLTPETTQNQQETSTATKDGDTNHTKYQNLIASIRDVVWSMDREFSLTFVSPAIEALLGYTPDEFMSLPLESHFAADFIPRFLAFKRKILREINDQYLLSPSVFEFEWRRKDGHRIWVETDISPLKEKDGTVKGFTGSIRNVTGRIKDRLELEQVKEAALDSSRAKSDFLAEMSHEIRTPMNGVLGMLQLLHSTILSPEQYEFVENGLRSGTNLLNLINEILDLSKIEARKVELKDNDILLNEMLGSVIADCKTLITSPDVSLTYTIEEDVPLQVTTDGSRLRQILINLIGNSIKYTETGAITVNVSCKARATKTAQLYFSVCDTGIGISNDATHHLFKPFVQADAPLNPNCQSTGLGLQIVKQLVELMGGTVGLESEKNRGTTVSFNLPMLLSKEFMPMGSTSDSRAPMETLPPMDVLVVEDEQVNALVVSSMLEHIGHSVTHVTSGLQAIELLETRTFDCIFMDIQMPEMDGIETSRAIRNNLSLSSSQVPIIALTAHAMKGDREQFLAAEMNECLTKPLHIHELKAVMHKIACT